MNAANSPLVTGAASMTYAGRSTRCAGRSLSNAHGSVSVPMVNSPAGTSTSPPTRTDGSGGGGACSTAGPERSWWVASMVSSCCCSCCTIMPKANPSATSGRSVKVTASSRSCTLSRTVPR